MPMAIALLRVQVRKALVLSLSRQDLHLNKPSGRRPVLGNVGTRVCRPAKLGSRFNSLMN
jgi:hypothetical protein